MFFTHSMLHAQSAKDFMRASQNGETMTTGANPYASADGEEGENTEPSDTTKKEKKIHKPLESYFFSDSIRALNNISWTINRSQNRIKLAPIDTTLLKWRIDNPSLENGVGDAILGGLGQSSMPLDYFARPTDQDFTFASGYNAYTFNAENVGFYNSKRPLMFFTYREAGQVRTREENFNIKIAQNISPTTAFNVDYKARGTRGLYEWSRSKNHNLALAFSHTGKRYTLHAAYFNNMIDQEENGGAVGAWAIADTTFESPALIPMKLSDAEAKNKFQNNAFFIQQSYAIALQRVTENDFSLADLSAIYVGHSLEYNTFSRKYTDKRATYIDERAERDPESNLWLPAEKLYYNDWYYNPSQTRDSINERRLSNRLYVQLQPWDRNGIVGTIDAGIGLDLHSYSQFSMGDYLTGKYNKENKTSFHAYGSIAGKFKKYVDWGADAKFYPSGYRGGDFRLAANLALKGYIRQKPLILEGRFVSEKRSPSYWQENLTSNHYIWSSPLDKENETRFEASLTIPSIALELSAKQGIITNKIYYDATSNVAQSSKAVSLTSVYARKDFRPGGFHFDHRVLLQWSGDQQVIPVPLFSAFLSYYYEFWVVKNVFRLQAGIDARYNSEYYAPGYNPALATFYNQRDVEVGNYPYMDLFFAGKWKRMRVSIKYQHINNGMGNGRSFNVATYPLNPGMLKIGISWAFYD